jgi:hypothetical protein
MNRSPCEKTNCVNYKNGFCTQKNPEKYDDSCIDYEDLAKSFRSKIRFKKGTLAIGKE